jgi:hypothetical protein
MIYSTWLWLEGVGWAIFFSDCGYINLTSLLFFASRTEFAPGVRPEYNVTK